MALRLRLERRCCLALQAVLCCTARVEESTTSSAFDEYETQMLVRAADRARLLGIALIALGGMLGFAALGAGARIMQQRLEVAAMTGAFTFVPAAVCVVVGLMYVMSAASLRKIVTGDGDERKLAVGAARFLGIAFLVQVGLVLLTTTPLLLTAIFGVLGR